MPYGNDPAASAADRLRLLIGDTATPPQLSDAEVTWFLSEAGDDATAGAAAAAEALATRYATMADSTVGDVSKSYAARAKNYAERAAALVAKVATSEAAPIPWAGGLYYDDPAATDASLIPPYFSEGMGLPAGYDERAWQ